MTFTSDGKIATIFCLDSAVFTFFFLLKIFPCKKFLRELFSTSYLYQFLPSGVNVMLEVAVVDALIRFVIVCLKYQ